MMGSIRAKARPMLAFGLAVLIAGTCLFSGQAYAKSACFVESWQDTGESTAYLTSISNENIQYQILDGRVGYMEPDIAPGSDMASFCDGDLDIGLFYYNQPLGWGDTVEIPNALRIDVPDAGYDVTGRAIDLTVHVDVTLHNNSGSTGLPTFLAVNSSSNPYGMWTYMAITYTPGTDATANFAAEVVTHMEIAYADTGEAFSGGLQICMNDIDAVSSSYEWREQVRLDSGFTDTVYLSNNTKLDRDALDSSGNTWFVATQPDNNSFLSGFAATTQGSQSSFTWRGTGCGTYFTKYYPNYPSSSLRAPVKSASPERVEWGDSASFQIEQTFPYVTSSNKASSIVFTDELDPTFDASAAVVKVSAGGKDVTSEWDVSIQGQKLTAAAKDTAKVQGDYAFSITVPIRSDADFSGYEKSSDGYWLIPNQAHTAVNGTVLDTGIAKVGTTYGSVELYKSSSNPSITDGNDLYSLVGAEYGVYKDESCSDKAGTLVLDESGYGKLERLRVGTYYLREDKAPEGFWPDDTVYTVKVTPMGTCTVEVEDDPINDPAPVLLQKQDKEIASAKQDG